MIKVELSYVIAVPYNQFLFEMVLTRKPSHCLAHFWQSGSTCRGDSWGFGSPGQRARDWASRAGWPHHCPPLHLPAERHPRLAKHMHRNLTTFLVCFWGDFFLWVFFFNNGKEKRFLKIYCLLQEKQQSSNPACICPLLAPTLGAPWEGGCCHCWGSARTASLRLCRLPPALPSSQATADVARVLFTAFFCLVHHTFPKDFTHLAIYRVSLLHNSTFGFITDFFKLKLNNHLPLTPATCQTTSSTHSSSIPTFLKCHGGEVLCPTTLSSLLLSTW